MAKRATLGKPTTKIAPPTLHHRLFHRPLGWPLAGAGLVALIAIFLIGLYAADRLQRRAYYAANHAKLNAALAQRRFFLPGEKTVNANFAGDYVRIFDCTLSEDGGQDGCRVIRGDKDEPEKFDDIVTESVLTLTLGENEARRQLGLEPISGRIDAAALARMTADWTPPAEIAAAAAPPLPADSVTPSEPGPIGDSAVDENAPLPGVEQ